MTDEIIEDGTRVERYDVSDAPQETREPDLPLRGEDSDLLAFTCWRCGADDYAPSDLLDVYAARRMRLFCLPCTHPDQFKWRAEVLEDGTERRRLYPVPDRDRLKRLGPGAAEREQLARAIYERSTLRDRRDLIVRWIAERQSEVDMIDRHAVELDAQIPALEDVVRRIELDQHKDVKDRAMQLMEQYERAREGLRAMGVELPLMPGSSSEEVQA